MDCLADHMWRHYPSPWCYSCSLDVFVCWSLSGPVVRLTFPSKSSVAPVVSAFCLESCNFSLIDHLPSFFYSPFLFSGISAPITSCKCL
jgi:hypothetical protein